VLRADPDSVIRGYRAVVAALASLVVFVVAPLPSGASREPASRRMDAVGLAREGATRRPSGEVPGREGTTRSTDQDGRHRLSRRNRERDRRVDLSAYEGLGAWIDIYDRGPWGHPTKTTGMLKRKGVRTIFLQTSNYGARAGVFRPARVGEFLEAAHRRHMDVVAWYVPSFSHSKRDLWRSLRAIRFRSDGERFDGFGLDIEATKVSRISVRNKRLFRLSKRIRRIAGNDFPLAAITPDPLASDYWPRFPWSAVARRFDILVPMGYFSFHASGYRKVLGYTTRAIRKVRRATRRVKRPIHLIGGIGGDAGSRSTRAFVRAVRRTNLIGASFYDAPVTSHAEWAELGVIAGRRTPNLRTAKRRRQAAGGRDREDRRGDRIGGERRRRARRAVRRVLRSSKV
jgi:hypothetical protein